MFHEVFHDYVLPLLTPRKGHRVVGKSVQHPGTSSGEARSEEKEERNKENLFIEKGKESVATKRLRAPPILAGIIWFYIAIESVRNFLQRA